MKKIGSIKNIALLLIMSLSFTKYVNASCSAPDLKSNSNFRGVDNGIVIHYKTVGGKDNPSFQFRHYTLNDSSGNSYLSICAEAGKGATYPPTDYVNKTFSCTEMIFDPSANSERLIHDAGVVTILDNGYDGIASLSDAEANIATTIAVRTYNMYWKGVMFDEISEDENTAYRYFTNLWADNFKELIKKATGKEFTKYPEAQIGVVNNIRYNGTNVTDKINDAAYHLVELGLDAAINYRNNPTSSSMLVTAVPETAASRKSTKDPATGVKTYEVVAEYKIDMKDFNTSSDTAKITVNCPQCAANGVSYTIRIDGNDYGTSLPANLLQTFGNREGLKMEIVFTATNSVYKCTNLKYTVEYSYTGSKTVGKGNTYYIYNHKECEATQKNKCQDFYVKLTPISGGTPVGGSSAVGKTIEADLNLCQKASGSCEELKDQCENDGNQEACEKFESEYNSKCVTCTAKVSNATCSKDGSSFDIAEGYVDEGNCNPTELNVKSCIIGNKDVNGVSFQDTNQISNEFCSVWCTESYHFDLPGDKSTTSYRNLQLRAEVTGTKTCYAELKKGDTETEDSFEYQYEQERENSILLYNLYNFYNSAYQASFDPSAYRVTYSQYNGYAYRLTWEFNMLKPDGSTLFTYDDIYNLPIYLYKGEENPYDPYEEREQNEYYDQFLSGVNGNQIYYGVTCSLYSNGRVRCIYNSEGMEALDPDDPPLNGQPFDYSHYQDMANDYKSKITFANSKMDSLVTQYNQCMNWDISYNFNPVVEFSYEEEYMDYFADNYMDTIQESVETSSQTEICLSDVNDAYECPAGSRVTSAAGQTGEVKLVIKEDAYGNLVQQNTIINLSQAKAMKKSITSKASYVVPDNYLNNFPSGGITEKEDDGDVPNASDFGHKLPIGGTKQGQYNYALVISNLGENYSTGQTGRIWGNSQSVVLKMLEDKSSCYAGSALTTSQNVGNLSTSTGGYVCEYSVNIPECSSEPDLICDPVCPNDPDCPDTPTPDDCTTTPDGVCDPNCPNDPDCNCSPGADDCCDPSNPSDPDCDKCTIPDGVCTPGCENDPDCNDCTTTPDGICDSNCPGDPDCPNPPGTCDPDPDGVCTPGCPDDPDCPDYCPDCPVHCDPSGCYFEDEDCPPEGCKVVCPRCLYNDGLNVQSRPVSPNDLNPNDRDLGVNWNSGLDPSNPDARVTIKTALQLKAYAATKEIVKNSSLIYDVVESSGNTLQTSTDDLAVQVNMNAAMKNWIHSYNESVSANGGYSNNNLECYDYEVGGKTYENIFCYSKFIDNLVDRYSDQVKFSIPRPSASVRAGHPNDTQYFTTWDRVISDDWVVTYTNYGLSTGTKDFFTTNFGYDEASGVDYGVGPSWK